MKVRNYARHLTEFLAIYVALVLVAPLPRRLILWLSRGLARLAFVFSRRDKRIALANVDFVYGTSLSKEAKLAIVQKAFETFGLVLLDLFWFRFCTRQRITRWVQFDASLDDYFRGGTWIIVTAHFGNWEVMGLAAALRGHGSASVAAPLDNPLLERVLTKWRRATGQEVVGRQGAVRELLKKLKNGQSVALLVDQNTLPNEGGIFVDFLGMPATMSPAAEMLARRTGRPVLPCFCAPDLKGGYRVFALPAIPPPGEATPKGAVTRQIAAAIERVVRADPGLWLWMYKRWKYFRTDMESERFPFYARLWKD